MVGELAQGLAVVKHEQEYMEVRERIHRMSESWYIHVIVVLVLKLYCCALGVAQTFSLRT